MPHQLQPRIKLAPAEYRYCSQCNTPMLLKQIVPVRAHLNSRKFECRKCHQAEEIVTPVGMLGRLLMALKERSRPLGRGAVSSTTGGSHTRPTHPTS